MKIVQFNAENIKRLKAVSITPDGNFVEISGKNGMGKSSILDAIWMAAGGAANIPSMPIRKGQKTAKVSLDLGEIKVIRTFNLQEDGRHTTNLTVESKDGLKFKTPQAIMDSMLGALTFDPLAFSRMKDRDQLDALKRFVPEVDFVAIERANADDFTKRTDENREAKALRTRAAAIAIPEDAPEERIDENALVERLELAGEENTQIERRRSRRASLLAETVRLEADALRLRVEADTLIARAVDAEKTAAANRAQIDGAGELPEPVDTAGITAQIAAARDANRWVDMRRQRLDLEAKATEIEARADALTVAIDSRKAAMREAIEKADLPLPGLGFGENEMLLNGVPFSQASGAEKLRTSIAIAMAANPKLRVLRVQDGSLLDDEGMAILAEMANASDYQVWVEKVGAGGRAAIVIEDGEVRAPVLAIAAE